MPHPTRDKIVAVLVAAIWLVLLGALVAFAWLAYQSALDYEEANARLADQARLAARISDAAASVLDFLAGPLYDGFKERAAMLARLEEARERYADTARLATAGFYVAAMLILGLSLLRPRQRKLLHLSLLSLSVLSLLVGLFAPILMLVTYVEVPGLSRVVLSFYSRGIVSTVETLFASGNYVVAVALLLFSILLPGAKLAVVLFALVVPYRAGAQKALEVMKAVGKWSMADVFVVALLLTFFTVNKDKHSNAEVQIGLFFFLGYVLLSMALTHVCGKPAPSVGVPPPAPDPARVPPNDQ